MTVVSVVVTNTTPVSNLIRIGQLPLLGLLFGCVYVPQQVVDELERGKHVLGAWREVPGAAALTVETPLDGPFLRQLAMHLDMGEAAAIALSVERCASLLLIDELDGRKAGRHHGLRITGTVGILLEGKRMGHISAVRPWIEALDREGFHISNALKEHVLASAKEVT